MHYFIHGPSGSGKSFIAQKLADAKDAYFLETDLWPPTDGMVAAGIKSEWDEFHSAIGFKNLDLRLNERGQRSHASCVVSLPGFPILTTVHLAVAAGRAKIIYLVGSPGQCLDAFLKREAETGRGLDMEHWVRNTINFFPALERPDIAPFLVRSFDATGQHRVIEDIIWDIDAVTHTG